MAMILSFDDSIVTIMYNCILTSSGTDSCVPVITLSAMSVTKELNYGGRQKNTTYGLLS
jgi:hypothetical protein